MTNVSTSQGLWLATKQIAGAQTKSRLLMLCSELQRTRKGVLRMCEYLAKIKDISDQLSLAGSPISLPDLMIQALAGLDAGYNPIVVQLSHQLSLNSNFVNYARADETFIPRGSWRGGRGNRGRNNNRGRGRNNRGRGRNSNHSNSNNNDVLKCQLCEKLGHDIETCFYRYDRSFVKPSRRNTEGNKSSSDDFDTAYWATPETVDDDSWYLDSGATSHVAKDLNKLEASTSTSGKMNVVVGDGFKLGVERIGSSTVQNVPHKKVKLDNILYAPKIKKNLISVYKVACDNGVDVIFNSNGVCVKDQATGETMLQGTPTDGVMFRICERKQDGNAALVFLTDEEAEVDSASKFNNFSKAFWHCRLGHPSNRVLNQLIS